MVGGIILAVVGFGLLVFVHELGHFLVAKWVGIRVDAFSLGFGYVLLKKTFKGTEYRLSLVPLGGYVKMEGQDDAHPDLPSSDSPTDFRNKKPWEKAAVISAGVIMNGIFGCLIFAVAFLGGVDFPSPEIGSLIPGSPAEEAGLQPGDIIQAVDGASIVAFNDYAQEVAVSSGPIEITYLRNGVTKKATVTPAYNESLGMQYTGIFPAVDLAVPDKASAAYQAGLRSNDRIVEINGYRIEKENDFRNILSFWPRGQEIRFVVERAQGSVKGEATVPLENVEIVPFIPTILPGNKDSLMLGLSILQNKISAITEDALPLVSQTFQPGDRIVRCNDRKIACQSQLITALLAGLDREVTIEVDRAGERVSMNLGMLNLEERMSLSVSSMEFEDEGEQGFIGLDTDFPDSPAEKAGIRNGDRLLRFNNEPLNSFTDLLNKLAKTRKDIAGTYVIERDGQELVFYLIPAPKEREEPVCSFEVRTYTYRESNPFIACVVGVKRSVMTVSAILRTISSIFTGTLSSSAIGGPILIAQIAYKTARVDFFYFLYFIAMVSINLGIVNLLPVPVLDGGHLVFIILEKIKGSPVSEKVQGYAQWVGLAAIGLLIIFLFYNDIMRTIRL